MPIIKSAKKRVKTAEKATVRNAKTKRNFRTAVKQFRASLATKKNSSEALSQAQSTIDTAVKKGLLHKKNAARKKQQLAKEAKDAGVKLTPASTKKTTAKKAPAKKKTTTKK